MKKFFRPFLSIVILLLTFAVAQARQLPDLTKYVNPFIGTGGHGHTYPGATMPHGMVQLSPDTRLDDWDGSSGYHYSDNVIYGFSHTHLSGTGIPDYCDILVRPTTDGSPFANATTSFSHQNEKAEPGYYSVKLDDGINAEMTTTARVGMHRYTFPKANATILFDLNWRDKVLDSEIKAVAKNRIEGFRRSSSWAKDQIVYFVAEFSKPFSKEVFSENGVIDSITERWRGAKGTNVKAAFSFNTSPGETVLVKVALSPTSIEGARKNLAAELPHWNFEKVRADAKRAWNKELGKIEVSGGTPEQMVNFYTALYHTQIVPNIFSDIDGKYMGMDRKVHQAKGFQPYTVFSLWDTFRAAHPLYTIIDQKRTVNYINTFLDHYDKGGRLPVWELAGNETDTMIGYHAVSVIADAMAKGIKGFDYEKAYKAAKHSAELDHFGLKDYRRRGYISMEDEQESVSKTLEYAYNDWCIALMAKILSEGVKNELKKASASWLEKSLDYKTNEFGEYIRRAMAYKNLFDKQTGFMRPRQNGDWVSPFLPNEVTFHFTEGNSWQYSFFVPHDVLGLIKMHGGRAEFEKKLDELFNTDAKLTGRVQPDITGLIGQYAHGNEPSHHVAYLYNYVRNPWKSQKMARKIMDEFYRPTPDGLIGNEDCGQMSAWYVLSAMGFYPVNPGEPEYSTGTPIFKEAKINLENGKTFIVRAPNVSEKNIYVKSAKLNGVGAFWSIFGVNRLLKHEEIMNGGVLEFEMSSKIPKYAAPSIIHFRSRGLYDEYIAVPVIEAKDRVFVDKTYISIRSISPYSKIRYTLDGSTPTKESQLYTAPFSIDKSTTVKAIVFDNSGDRQFSNSDYRQSLSAEAVFHKMPNDWSVELFSKYNRQYTGGGPEGLIDGIRGTTNFASGEWQGYQSQDFIAVIDLKKETEITELGAGFLQVAESWVWMPTKVEFETSLDGKNFTKAAEIITDVSTENMERIIKDYKTKITKTKACYVRVKATNLGKIPAWHPGAGFDAFIFVDEIFIN